MKDGDEQLLQTLARRNWLILAGLLLLSLFWRSRTVSLGVFAGGLVAIIGYRWLHLSLERMLARPDQRAARRFQSGYIVRLAALAASLYLLIAVVRVHPVGLAVGLSVVVLNIVWATIQRSI